MTKRKEVHTSGNRNKGYKNTINGNKIGKIYKTKKEAKEEGRKIAKENGAEHIIHDKDGKIQESNSYGNDPFPPEDKK